MKPKAPKPPRDVITNAHRVFGELIERSEQPPNRGVLKPVNRDGVMKKPKKPKAR